MFVRPLGPFFVSAEMVSGAISAVCTAQTDFACICDFGRFVGLCCG